MKSIENIFNLQGESALITGGGTGIGFAIAECFVAAGAKVVIAGRREQVLKDASQALGPDVTYRVYDVTNCSEAGTLIDSIKDEIGGVSILVNNAGHIVKRPVEELSIDEFEGQIHAHVTGAFALCRAVIPSMKDAGRGSILFTASMTSVFGLPQVTGYSAAKTALLGMVRSLTVELAPHGIRTNAIAPGWIATELLKGTVDADPERKRKVLSRTPMGRFGDPDDIGWAAVYLCSPAAKFVSGVCLPVDGGISIGF